MQNNKLADYEEEWFETLYKRKMGSYSYEDLDRNKKWFYAWLQLINKTIHMKPGSSVLEIACPIGGVSALLHDQGYDVVATDVSKYVIKRAKKIRPDITFATLDVGKKIKLKKRFDYILSFEVLEHVENPEKAILNMKDSLKKGGWIIFSTPPPYQRFLDTPTHINVHDEHYWTNLLKKSGFSKSNIMFKKVTFIPVFYRFSKHFNVALPGNIDIPKANSTIFYFAKK